MIGAQASNDQFEKIMFYLDIGDQEGAEVLTGGARADLGGDLSGCYYVQPTIFKGNNKMRIFQEEIFGPVVSVATFSDYDDAISTTNDTLYRLGAGVTVYKGLKRTEVKPGQWVVISGIGGLGHIAVQYAVAMGRRVIAVDVADDKLALARMHGAEITVNAFAEEPADIIQEKVAGSSAPPQDLVEALEFYAAGKIHPTYSLRPLSDINAIFDEMINGKIDGRVVIEY